MVVTYSYTKVVPKLDYNESASRSFTMEVCLWRRGRRRDICDVDFASRDVN